MVKGGGLLPQYYDLLQRRIKMTEAERLYNSGVLTSDRKGQKGAVLPSQDFWDNKKNGLVIVECPERIPCNPCNTSCPTGAILPFKDINDHPEIDYTKCTGCAMCVAACPGLACFVIDMTFSTEEALYKLPYEMLPRPQKGDKVKCLDRTGKEITEGTVQNVTEPYKDSTLIIHVSAPKILFNEIRAVRVVN
jgi:Fe-S-cluster-containing hydrogenase component 2